jgi:hypothetical protein
MHFTKGDRASHPQAKLIPEALWIKNHQIKASTFPGLNYLGITKKPIFRGLFEEHLSELEIALLDGYIMTHKMRFNGKNSTEQLKKWLCALLSLKESSATEIVEIARALRIPLKTQLKGAALANRIDLLNEIELNTMGFFRSTKKSTIKTAISEDQYNLCHQLCALGYVECLKKISELSSIEMSIIIARFKKEYAIPTQKSHHQENVLLQRLITRLKLDESQPPLDSLLTSFTENFFSHFTKDSQHLWVLEWLQQESSESQWNKLIQPLILE